MEKHRVKSALVREVLLDMANPSNLYTTPDISGGMEEDFGITECSVAGDRLSKGTTRQFDPRSADGGVVIRDMQIQAVHSALLELTGYDWGLNMQLPFIKQKESTRYLYENMTNVEPEEFKQTIIQLARQLTNEKSTQKLTTFQTKVDEIFSARLEERLAQTELTGAIR